MAAPGPSTATSSTMKYHVFLSFRGTDTRTNFTDHLYAALLRRGILTFRDDEDLPRGEVISDKLVQAIEQSMFAIVVLSENYASSSWCLDELHKIIESKRDSDQTVFPVFYGIDPADVRHQKRKFATAFETHEVGFSDVKVQRWREALTKIANLSGWDTRNKYEAEIVEDIVGSVHKLCCKLPSNFEHLVGDVPSKKHDLIGDINDDKETWSIVARVIRKWPLKRKDPPFAVWGITMVLMDEKGCRIEAGVQNKCWLERYMEEPLEGKIFVFENFNVLPNNSQYKTTVHPWKLGLHGSTYFKEEDASIPDYIYDFISIEDILDHSRKAEALFDVIGLLRSFGTVKKQKLQFDTIPRLDFTIADEQEKSITVRLFGHCATDTFYSNQLVEDLHHVVVIQFARINIDKVDPQKIQLSNFVTATRVYFNPDIPEVHNLLKRLQESSEMPQNFTQDVNLESKESTTSSMITFPKRFTIDQISTIDEACEIVIRARIKKLETALGWCYKGCVVHESKLKEENGQLYCEKCKKEKSLSELKFKVHYTVVDNTGTASVVFFNKLAEQLIQSKAIKLKKLLDKERRSHSFPSKLSDCIGKELLMKVNVTDYNMNHRSSSLTVTEFSDDNSLLRLFTLSNKEVQEWGSNINSRR
ncbi:replication protein A 70 kDa DNA-binding subunit A-like isoform X2 [Prosopis cineraria]|uniref:replication protein A 70 kDa DNA-binding subunit A-like isoform X2 n=1 Tax=Prosopis cineraria TaxID=364024 RepID=UPI0024103961|nr:replication protein A 70 kDa DNA-binding subunit A-like isoform X2 [Prosopis cineraria]